MESYKDQVAFKRTLPNNYHTKDKPKVGLGCIYCQASPETVTLGPSIIYLSSLEGNLDKTAPSKPQ